MTFKEKKDKMNYLLDLIQRGRLHSLEQTAVHFCCSKRTIERMISDLRGEGYAIHYCRVKRRYILKMEFQIANTIKNDCYFYSIFSSYGMVSKE